MGKGNQPTPEELKFVYKMLDEGYSDADILGKYEELKRHGNLGSLPYRYANRFIRQRRKEFEVKEVSSDDIFASYVEKYYKTDYYYRKFYEYYDLLDTAFQNEMEQLREKIENFYKMKQMEELSRIWSDSSRGKMVDFCFIVSRILRISSSVPHLINSIAAVDIAE